MNAVGIDVSKEKSTVVILRPFGEVVAAPYDVSHTDSELDRLAKVIKKLPGETRVVMEATGVYYEPVARRLHEHGIFVSVVNPVLISDYGDNTLRKAKTDRKDAIKIASYALSAWLDLVEYKPEEDRRRTLKSLNRQVKKVIKVNTMLKNNLISLTDTAFPGINKLFTSQERPSDGHLKWVDFVAKFSHRDTVAKLSLNAFKKKYKSWCEKNKYHYQDSKAEEIHAHARKCVAGVSAEETFCLMVTKAAEFVNAACENENTLKNEMDRLSSTLPEYEVVMGMYGVGKSTGPQLMAEIGDTRRFRNRRAITAFFGYDTEPDDSGQHISKSRPITKKGSPSLRRTLFIIMKTLVTKKPVDNPVYAFLDKKRSEGKHYYSYMTAASAKFLRIYYAKVNEVLNKKETSMCT
ncbi:MAG: IS110 family transposase [Acutalibacteraceae bacterium]|nr:IS110 family transposase [Acutalibacteraceae bacterium]